MKRLFLIPLLIMLIAGLILGVYDKPAPAQAAAPHKEVTLKLYSSAPKGAPPYKSVLGLATVMSEKHPWLKGEAIGSRLPDSIIEISKMPPEQKKYALPAWLPTVDYLAARAGVGPRGHLYPEKLPDLMYAGNYDVEIWTFITRNPELAKDPMKLAGKKVGTPYEYQGASIGSPQVLCEAILRDAWGIADKVEYVEKVPIPKVPEFITTKQADAVFWGLLTLMPNGKWGTFPPHYKLYASEQTYLIPLSQADVDKINAKNVWKTDVIKMAKGSLFIPGKASTVTPPEDITAARFGSTIAAWKDCEAEVVYEFLKFLEENGAAISEKTHAMLTLETLSNFTPGVTRELFHPGAIRFFEEKGVKIPQ